MKRAAALGMIIFLGACTSTKPDPDSWLLIEGWTRNTAFGDSALKGKSGQAYPVSGAHMQNLRLALLPLLEQANLNPRIALVASDTPNAFATAQRGEQIVGLTLPMLQLIGGDKDALATTLGHELAHLKLNHGNTRKQRNDSAKGLSLVLGTVLSVAGVPFGGTIADLGVTTVTSAYSRDEEREADELGLRWAMAAGFSACGSARTMRLLAKENASTLLPFLASHPGHEERIERANKISLAASGAAC